ncbi:carbohydrate-binding family 9-like protein, partial [candidate division KSB1 bacterium]|nr:carbohydrate-binding family 9-like protein [candidate division KSB1 bacterium]
WQHAEWTHDFVDIEGSLKPKPRFRTRVKMLWDDLYIYIFAEMQEPDIWATLKKRDSIIFYDNDFEVFIDPDGDTHRYYELEINAFSTEWDLFLDKPYRDEGRAVFYWDIDGMQSNVHVNGTINRPGDQDKGWTLEIALPWAVLKECADRDAPPTAGDQWRINFSRVEWQVEVKNDKYEKIINPETGKPFPEDNWVWSPQGVVNMHYPEMWGFVQFSDKIAGSAVDEFNYRFEEDIKWALRQIYYREKSFYDSTGKFTDKIEELGLKNMKVKDCFLPPQIYATPSLFEAILQNMTGESEWHITNEGRVWFSKITNSK